MRKVEGGGPPSGHKVTPVVHPLYCLVNAGSCRKGTGGSCCFLVAILTSHFDSLYMISPISMASFFCSAMYAVVTDSVIGPH